jgi:methyl-accepting chemotaxis protein
MPSQTDDTLQNAPSWYQTIGFRLGGIFFLLVLLLGISIASNFFILDMAEETQQRSQSLTRARRHALRMLVFIARMPLFSPEERLGLRRGIRERDALISQDLDALWRGNPDLRVPAPPDSATRDVLRKQHEVYITGIRPLLEELLTATEPAQMQALDSELESQINGVITAIQEVIDEQQVSAQRAITRLRQVEMGMGALALVLLALALLVVRGINSRVAKLADSSRRIAGGELGLSTGVEGTDELAALGAAVNQMARSLRTKLDQEAQNRGQLEATLREIAGIVQRLSSAASEIVAATTQQVAGVQQQTSSVAETVSTVEEVSATAEQAAQRAAMISEASRRMEDTSREGRHAVEETRAAMERTRREMGNLAEAILALAEKGQAIGEVVTSISEIAEQTHVLALNAAIEATRASEQGKGFSVVAQEVKALADQARQATGEVRKLLGDVQKATQSAVMVAEEGNKGAQEAFGVVGKAGEVIRVLGEHVTESARSAAQTVASAGQQATGMAQIRQAMRQINEAATQSMASSRQTEVAAQDLSQLGIQLRQIVERFQR